MGSQVAEVAATYLDNGIVDAVDRNVEPFTTSADRIAALVYVQRPTCHRCVHSAALLRTSVGDREDHLVPRCARLEALHSTWSKRFVETYEGSR